jgi:CRISPR-associated protein Cas1
LRIEQFARAVVGGNVGNSVELIARHQRNHLELDLAEQARQLRALRHSIAQAPSLDSLRGLEGQAAALYFHCFARMLRRSFGFERRTRRPPTSPINARLSLGYALLYNEAISAPSAPGFDPYLGFYHQPHHGRCSLALDLIEEMRPIVADRLALSLVNMEIAKQDDFHNDSGAVTLGERGRRNF